MFEKLKIELYKKYLLLKIKCIFDDLNLKLFVDLIKEN